ncbi:MAG: hypothetical protein ACD_76C00044G0008 [uncultured bacterium]|nr:MAG: hypothetical protein ACD_76C00044G0008 [uncultured bacterium]HBD05185.1 hypothetical protein [Candidatus Uhrbacteria bacterium]
MQTNQNKRFRLAFVVLSLFIFSGLFVFVLPVSAGPELDCGDGLDNDGDTDIDCKDDDCSNSVSCTSSVSPQPEFEVNCTDRIDDDADGATDCADDDCGSQCTSSEFEVNCTDGIDDDSDGATDCADDDCGSQCTSVTSSGECTCWCTKDDGAYWKGKVADRAICTTECGSDDVLSCSQNPSDSPLRNSRCWTEEQCAGSKGGGVIQAVSECKQGMGYCYSDDKIPLSVGIPDFAGGAIGADGKEKPLIFEVEDIGQYIRILYLYLTYAAGIFAIVMIMIGGVQWIIGSGVGDIKQAQHRISQAVIGLVLVFGAYLLLYTVSPSLVDLQTLRIPKIKQMEFVNQSCEQFIADEYTVERDGSEVTSGACGDEDGEVTAEPTGKEGTVVLPVPCSFITCKTPGAACVAFEQERICSSCSEIRKISVNGFQPSMCAAIDAALKTQNTQDSCLYDALHANVDLLDACMLVKPNCESIINQEGDRCKGYEQMLVQAYPNQTRPLSTLNGFPTILETFCGADTCQVSHEFGCKFTQPDGVNLNGTCSCASGGECTKILNWCSGVNECSDYKSAANATGQDWEAACRGDYCLLGPCQVDTTLRNECEPADENWCLNVDVCEDYKDAATGAGEDWENACQDDVCNVDSCEVDRTFINECVSI